MGFDSGDPLRLTPQPDGKWFPNDGCAEGGLSRARSDSPSDGLCGHSRRAVLDGSLIVSMTPSTSGSMNTGLSNATAYRIDVSGCAHLFLARHRPKNLRAAPLLAAA